MNEELKIKYEILKNKNKEKIKKEERENNTLLKECLEVLQNDGYILDNDEELLVYKKFKSLLIFTPWGIDWDEGKNIRNIRHINHKCELKNICLNNEYYIIWGKGLPIIRCGINSIIEYLDDIRAVDTDTWLLSTKYEEVIEFYHEGKIVMGEIVK